MNRMNKLGTTEYLHEAVSVLKHYTSILNRAIACNEMQPEDLCFDSDGHITVIGKIFYHAHDFCVGYQWESILNSIELDKLETLVKTEESKLGIKICKK